MKLALLSKLAGIPLLALCAVLGCKDKGEFYVTSEVKGQVFREDTLLNPGVKSIADSVSVYLVRQQDNARILSVITGTDGRFKFSYKPDKEAVFFESTLVDKGIEYVGMAPYGNQAEIVLRPLSKGLRVKVTGPNGEPLPKAIICFSPSAAEINLLPCDSTSARAYSNEQGLSFIPLPAIPRPYYIKTRRRIGNRTLTGDTIKNFNGGVDAVVVEMKFE